MKKVICIVLLVVMLLTMFTGCVGKFECDLCGEEKFGVKNEGKVLGMTVTYCSDCKEGLDELKDLFS